MPSLPSPVPQAPLGAATTMVTQAPTATQASSTSPSLPGTVTQAPEVTQAPTATQA
eukprot:CAMPEP_0195043210 /NCGR_PEP_ID=MMETSP0347-20130606/3933_1 /TAXON_ID=2932 /ORGANISM="Alexandrium fundyense, Strain CCMP1719" /LENGTH=55 /DNA_ID=CAMNT_0040070587 /DNA_START=15 /DNA_END=178 /DNA_ORIENTATION=-